MRKQLTRLGVGLAIVALLFGWYRSYQVARRAVLGQEITPQTLHTWWLLIVGMYMLSFFLTSVFILLFFRVLRRRVAVFLQVACIANALVVWLLFALSAVTSDAVTLQAVSPIGLASLHDWLWCLGIFWCAPSLYILFRSVDFSQSKSGG